MDEQRQYFRVINHGNIKAYYKKSDLDVINISSKGALVIKKQVFLPKKGIILLEIAGTSMEITYEILREDDTTMVLIFQDQKKIDELFVILKRIRMIRPV